MKEEIQELIEEEPLDALQEQFFQDTLNSRLNSQTISTGNNTDNRIENARVDVKNQEVLEISAIDNQLKIIPRNNLVYQPERNRSNKYGQYGNTGCRVCKREIQISKFLEFKVLQLIFSTGNRKSSEVPQIERAEDRLQIDLEVKGL